MALFKILKGQEKNLPANKTEGWAYVTTDEGNMYVDVSASKRVRIGAHADKADVATKAEGDTKPIREIYLAKLKQVTSDGTTFSFRGETGNGTNAPDLISIPLAGDKAGLISNAAQTIKGEKTFANGINFPTIATWPTPSTETYPIKSQGLIWSGSSDSAAIFYEVQASDKGMLVIESSDDSNAGLEIRNAASKKKVTIVDGRFIGDLTGTADYASKAQGDSQTIRSKYVSSVVKKSGSNYIFTVTKGDGTTNDVDLYFAASSSCGGDANVARSLRGAGRLDTQEKIDNFLTGSLLQYAVFKTAAQNNVNFASNDGMILSIPWDSSDYGAQIAFDDNTTPAVKVRGKNKTWGAWKTVAFTDGTIENANYADKAKGDTTSIRTTYIHKIKQVTSDGTTFTFRGEYGDGSNANDLITIPAASSSIAGLITTGAQTIAGNKTFANGLIVSATSGFNYSGIEAGTADSVRPIWFSDSNKSGTPVINSSKFTYNPYTNRMVVGNITLNGKDIASNYLTKVEKVDNIKVKATTGDGTSNTFTLDFLPLAGGTMTGAINFDHSQKRIISRTQLNSTTVNSGNNAHKLTLPVTNDNASTALMMHVANGNSDFGVFYLSEDTAFIANSGDTGYVFKVIDKDTNGGITDYNDNVSTMFAIKQGSGGIIMRGPLEPLVTESQNIGSTTMFWNNVYAKYFKGIADRATSDSGNQVIVDTYIKAIEYITHATQPKLKYTKGGGSTTELNMPIASASLAGLVTADAKDVIQSFSGDKTFNGCVRIKPTSDNARQGLRIGSVGGWSMITLGASSDAGYDVKSWHIANNNGAFYITHNGSSESSGSKGRLMSDENGNWQIHNRLGINGQNVGYQFYVNGTSLHTNTITIDPNTVAMDFRNYDTYHTTISYQTAGNEALVFASKNSVTSFMFVNGEDSITNHRSDRWNTLTPGLQIKQNCVSIGERWASDTNATHKLRVNGSSYFHNGDLRIDTSAGTYGLYIRRTSDGEAVKHWVDDSYYHLDYTNDKTFNGIAFRFINTDTEDGSGANASDRTIYLDSNCRFYTSVADFGDIGQKEKYWLNAFIKNINSSTIHNQNFYPLATGGDVEFNLNDTGTMWIYGSIDVSKNAYIGADQAIAGHLVIGDDVLQTTHRLWVKEGTSLFEDNIWLATDKFIGFKGVGQSTSTRTQMGYANKCWSNSEMHSHGSNGANTAGAFYIQTNGYGASNDTGGIAIDNEGVTVFGAGDGGDNFTGVFRVINEDAPANGPMFNVQKTGDTFIYKSLGINGTNIGYNFYVNGTSLHTNTINIDPNTVALNFRYNDANLYSTISYQTSGNEALVFANKYPYASFLFITNEDSVTNHGSNRWQSLTNTGLQIKENCVQIGGLWGNDVHPDYKLKVNGTSYFTDNIRIPRTKALIQDQVSTSNYTSIIEWRKGGGAGQSGFTYNPQVGQYNVGGADGSGSICVLPYATSTDPWGGSVGLYICRGQAKLDGHRLLTSHYAAIDSGVKLTSAYSWISIAGTSSFTCPDGTAITQPGGENPMVLYAGAASARDCGIFYLSNDNAYIANSSDNAYTFGVFDTDITQNFSTEGNASFCVRSNGVGTFVRSRLGVNGINDSYNLYVNGTAYFNGQVTATQFNGPLNGNATSATKLVYGPILNSDTAINSFHAANTFQAAVWTETSFPGVSNGIILDMGYTSATYGVQIAIDDDPTYFMALRQKGSSGWNAWKRIPMGDGTGASGTWSISITGNAANADTLDGYHASTVYRAATHGIQNYSATNDWLRIATITINGSTLSMGGFTAIFSNRECLDSSSFILTVAIRRNDTTSVSCQAYVTPIGTSAPREILVRSDDGVNFYVYFKSALNSWTTYYNVTKIMSENNVKFENVSLPASNLITGSVLNVTASRGGYVYRAQNADVATSSGYLTKKAAYTTIAEVDAFLEADKVQWVTVSAAATSLNNDGIVMSYGWNSSYGAQMYLDDGGGAANCYIRNRSGSGWNPWRRLWASGDSVTSAVWNDYAECRKSDSQEPGYVMFEKGDDSLSKTVERLQHFAGVVSDTWGFSQGETADAKTNIAVAGRVLAYPYRDRNEYKPGDCVCAAPGGKVDIMTREEIIQYPDRIVGTVSCVPDYEEWGGGELADRDPVKVNGRIWIKVK